MKLRYVGVAVQTVVTVILSVLLVCNLYILAAKKFMDIQYPTVFGLSSAVVVSGSLHCRSMTSL